MQPVCPIDKKSDSIQKISAILDSQTASGSFAGPSGSVVNIDGKWGAAGGYTFLKGSSMTDLARQLVPPPEPKQPKRPNAAAGCACGIALIAGWLVGVLCLYVSMATPVLYRPSANGGKEPTLFAVMLVVAALSLSAAVIWRIIKRPLVQSEDAGFSRDWEAYTEAHPKWQHAMLKWERSYYCGRHGIVFDPEGGGQGEPKAFIQFLYEGT